MKYTKSYLAISLNILLSVSILIAGGSKSKQKSASHPSNLNRISGLGVDANQHGNRRLAVHNGNKILTRFSNYGAIADYRNSPGRYDCGIYPIGSGRSYLAEFAPLVATEVPNTAGGGFLNVMSDGRPISADGPATGDYLWQFEPTQGFANSNDSLIAMSDDSLSWPESWANLPEDWDGVWAGQYGKYSRADQESYFHMDDFNNDEFKHYPFKRDDVQHFGEVIPFSNPDSNTYALLIDMNTSFEGLARDIQQSEALDVRSGLRPDVIKVEDDKWYQIDSLLNDHTLRVKSFIGRSNASPAGTEYSIYDGIKRGIGVDVSVRGYQWAHPAAEDILIYTYWIQNVSSWDYSKFIFGMYGDADVGDDGDQHDDDAWFDTMNDIVYQWDHDLWSHNDGGFVPAYFGWKYLESPGNPLDNLDNDDDGMIDESQDDGIDNDGDWDPYVDDIGADGIGSNFGEYTGPDLDGTEGNGVPDAGEPNFEYTDNDESDQIGLTSFTAAAWPGIDLTQDGVTWGQLTPGSFTNIAQTVDLTFMYGSAYFALPKQEERKFAVAVIFGNDYEDILRNSATMQQIYNSDYNFAKPPNLPKVTAVPGDGSVTLYWDDKAEYSLDPIYGMDFEGYRIYRATDPAFNEIWNITDTYGNQTFNKPIAQFDVANGLTGPHPYGLNGIHLDMGTDTGLRHSWTDTTVNNGQTYYYAVVAYDYGYDYDFYERGISQIDLRPPITPSECTKKIEINASGDAVKFAINTTVVVPNAPAMAYLQPEIIADATTTLGTGSLEVVIVDPSKIRSSDQYQITFRDWSEDGIDNDYDWRTWTDDSTTLDLSATLQMLIPPNSDTLVITLPGSQFFQGITATTERFTFNGFNFITTLVDTQTVTGDSTYIQYFINIPDTSITLFPTLGLWDGWENIYDDVGMDGCGDEYETGDPDNPCSDVALNLGNDPNQDNWNGITNPNGTQANAKPDVGETHFDMNDVDEIPRHTSSYQVKNLTTGTVLLADQTNFSGEGRGLVSEGFKVNIRNDQIGLNTAETGWMTPGLNYEINISADANANVGLITVPFDYLLTLNPTVTDTSFLYNKRLAFSIHDLTNDLPVSIVAQTLTDSILRPGSVIYPTLQAGGEHRVTWKMITRSKVGDVKRIAQWDDLTVFATSSQGLGVFNGETWTNITVDEGLLTNNISDIAYDNSGRLMVASSGGLSIHDQYSWENHDIDLIVEAGNTEEEKHDFLSFDKVLEDQDGILWSISDKGIVRWDWHRSQIAELWGENEITYMNFRNGAFNTISGDTVETGVIQHESTALIALDDGTIVVGTVSEGIEFYQPSDSSFWYLNRDNSSISTDKIICLATNQTELFIGTKDKGLLVYNFALDSITYANKDSLLDKKINDIIVGADGRLHLATKKGYNIVDFTEQNTVHYTAYTADDVPEFGTDVVISVNELDDGSIWIGTENSVARLKDGQWENWAPEPGDQFIIKARKPFSAHDVLTFTATGGDIDMLAPASLLEEISVVPNPYVVTAAWEPQHLYDSGRGVRKIDFIHLPPECTISIYTLSGKFVNSLEHNSEIWDGAESWNLLSRDGLEIAYGVYLYHIDAPGIGTHVSKFAVIK